MGILFGTDGIRGVANTYPMTAEMAMTVGRALAVLFAPSDGAPFVIGRDTRISGHMLAHALAAGICSMGGNVAMAGVLPTPGGGAPHASRKGGRRNRHLRLPQPVPGQRNQGFQRGRIQTLGCIRGRNRGAGV